MQLITDYAMQFIGRPYHWSGDDPIEGFDCSGYVQELMTAAGIFARGEAKKNAQMLFEHMVKIGVPNKREEGAIAFFGKDVYNVIHIGYCIDDQRMLHAGGGGSSVVDNSTAAQKNAFVRMDLIQYRQDFLCVIKPEYPGMVTT